MRISLCIPAYGREEMLAQAIHSVLLQEHQDWEIVIRDDNSEKPVRDCPDIARLFDFVGSRLRYVVAQHSGVYSKVANETLALATGDILGMLASDDLLAPGALWAINAAFESELFHGPFWIYGKTVSVDSHLRITGIDGHATTYEQLVKQNCIGCPSTYWNRQMMLAAGKFDTRYKWATDYDLWLRFWNIREPMFLDQEIGIFRHHAVQLSTERAAEIEAEAKHISVRHSTMRANIFRARSVQLTRQAYSGEEMPLAHD